MSVYIYIYIRIYARVNMYTSIYICVYRCISYLSYNFWSDLILASMT